MAKKAAAPKFVPPTEVEVEYDIDRLPSAQHKAGLAGLLLQIEDMVERRSVGLLKPADLPLPEVTARTPTTAKIRFTATSIQNLFDDLYDAELVEIRSRSRWSKPPEKRIDPNLNPKEGEPKQWFIYDMERPSGHFLARYTEGEKDRWHKLWRDMLYAVPRNKPTTRQAYKTRAEIDPANPGGKKPTKEGGDAWKSLIDREKAKLRGAVATDELAGSLMLAVQAVTAEVVPFLDRVEDQILLHFWVLTARIFVPQVLDDEGKGQFVGYALAIPEVADLDLFQDAYKGWLLNLGTKPAGYRPLGAVVALPEQGPLELLDNLDRLVIQQTLKAKPARYIAGVEFFHMVVTGNNVKLRGHGRIPVVEAIIDKYRGLRDAYHNNIFLKGLLLALLRNQPWFAELKAPLHEQDWSFFVHCTQERQRTPPMMVGFAWEVQRYFQHRSELVEAQMGSAAEEVDKIVYEVVGSYVKKLACADARIKESDPEWWSMAANERREVCAKLQLEFRSRREEEFVEFFGYKFSAAVQWLPLDKYLLLAGALMTAYPDPAKDGPDRPRTRDDVKMLTLLALAGHSRSIKQKETTSAAPIIPETET